MPRRLRVDPVAERFGAIIRALRKQHGWTLEQLARRTDMNAAYLGYIERGENMPTLKVVLELASVLGVDAGALVNRVATPPKTASLEQV